LNKAGKQWRKLSTHKVEKEYLKMRFSKKPVGHIGALPVGMGFGAG
jgi:hypothetical protein